MIGIIDRLAGAPLMWVALTIWGGNGGREVNITLSIDEDVVKKVRKVAIDKDTTLTAMVRDYLMSVAESDAAARREAAAKLRESIDRNSRDMGPRTWTRDGLYYRPKRFYQ